MFKSRFISCCVIFFVIMIHMPVMAISAQSYVLIDAQSGRVLKEGNAHEKRGPASTTKILTAIVAIENGNLSDVVVVSRAAAYVEGSSMWLAEGEKITLENLLYGLMLNSGNDAATAIAEHIGGSISGFAEMMNATAARIGAKNSSFENPHGLDSPAHYTTAYDLALITRYAMQNPKFAEIVGTKTKAVPWEGNGYNRSLSNHNKLLTMYSGADGVKTGFTKKTGRCLVSSAQRDGVKLIAVTLNAPDDWNDHTTLLDFGFNNYSKITLIPAYFYAKTLPVISGKSSYAMIAFEQEVSVAVTNAEKEKLSISYSMPEFLTAPVLPNQKVGEVIVTLGEKQIAKVNLICQNEVQMAHAPSILNNFGILWEILLSFF